MSKIGQARDETGILGIFKRSTKLVHLVSQERRCEAFWYEQDHKSTRCDNILNVQNYSYLLSYPNLEMLSHLKILPLVSAYALIKTNNQKYFYLLLKTKLNLL